MLKFLEALTLTLSKDYSTIHSCEEQNISGIIKYHSVTHLLLSDTVKMQVLILLVEEGVQKLRMIVKVRC